jgi:hypothetical protein
MNNQKNVPIEIGTGLFIGTGNYLKLLHVPIDPINPMKNEIRTRKRTGLGTSYYLYLSYILIGLIGSLL